MKLYTTDAGTGDTRLVADLWLLDYGERMAVEVVVKALRASGVLAWDRKVTACRVWCSGGVDEETGEEFGPCFLGWEFEV